MYTLQSFLKQLVRNLLRLFMPQSVEEKLESASLNESLTNLGIPLQGVGTQKCHVTKWNGKQGHTLQLNSLLTWIF